jgi:hypothetical protein
MTAFFTGGTILFDGYSEAFGGIIARTEMERGFARQRKIQSDVVVTETVSLLLKTKQAIADFDTWFYTSIAAGASFFDWTSPRTAVVVQARIVNGDIGALQPHSSHFAASHRSFKVEWLKSL